jgi:hypothetical protein
MLDEFEKRRYPFVAEPHSVPVKFADGQDWIVPKPFFQLRPRFKDGVATHCDRGISYGRDIDALLELVARADDVDMKLSAIAGLAAYQLKLNYNLDDAELDQLLQFRADDPGTRGWATACLNVATGKFGVRGRKEGS